MQNFLSHPAANALLAAPLRLDNLFTHLSRPQLEDPLEDLVYGFLVHANNQIADLLDDAPEVREEAARHCAFAVTHALLAMKISARDLGLLVARHLNVTPETLIMDLAKGGHTLVDMDLISNLTSAFAAHDSRHDDALAAQYLAPALLSLWRILNAMNINLTEYYAEFDEEFEDDLDLDAALPASGPARMVA
ncbi:hypothetical protein [Deinococcus soli (ex Cha et al. 2016)]|uniref:Uncharacterized protein n=2 Tax=Deinococcus soli (ex Cha et al. 2016) TaxID=1309411 RepID=A0ACC6KG40_9DEIO|nr:hypothetical protein [Deinococcus soli (ex Cha et al. 2016)]MDR6218391.1 hypothetical protein [Deinococcus soli (ex Cha et al. 2016)]MDR6329131.1 hypothetical protein [Deinococcus soli (ex Cha et al. 2016)]MDR6751404.1 hypothetical protein [Deinococcus soli (ex Cha et al. 2016)]